MGNTISSSPLTRETRGKPQALSNGSHHKRPAPSSPNPTPVGRIGSGRGRTILGLVLLVGSACMPIGPWIHEFENTTHLLANEAIWWSLVCFVFLYVRKVERRSLQSIGFSSIELSHAALGLIAGVLTVFLFGIMYLYILPMLGIGDGIASTHNAAELMATPLWWRLISAVRAGVAEEVIFRGYAIERTIGLTRNRTIAVLAPLAVFTFAHVPIWGWSHVPIVALGGLVFSLLYVWRRNLWTNIVAHVVVDVVAVIT